MKRIIAAITIVFLISTNAYALNPLERLAYKEVTLKTFGQRILVNRITGQVKYRWQGPTAVMIYGEAAQNGKWMPLYDRDREMWQNIYDQEGRP